MVQELTVDLGRPPEDRWHLTPAQGEQARELLALYKEDLGISPDAVEAVSAAAEGLCRPEHWSEMESLARLLEVPLDDVVLGNCYYDDLKAVLGCSAFAIDSPDGILHARNLDWWTGNGALSRHTLVSHFMGGACGEFTTIGWPGFIGAFSGVAPGRFAVTLNAVLSREDLQLEMPVAFLLRTALEEAQSFDDALAMLTTTPISSDCLLLITGTRTGEMAVIERTPSRHAVRRAQRGFISVTNDYQQLKTINGPMGSELLATSCARLQRLEELLGTEPPGTSESCFNCLSDPSVRMRITVQQMVFRAATGDYWVRLPSPG